MSLSQISSLPPGQQEAILNGPALKPPPGVLPNLLDPPNENHMVSSVTIVCTVAVTCAVILRFVLEVFIMKKFRIPDGEWPKMLGFLFKPYANTEDKKALLIAGYVC